MRWLIDWWRSRHVCDDEILESDNAGYVSQCRICKRLIMYPGGEICRPRPSAQTRSA